MKIYIMTKVYYRSNNLNTSLKVKQSIKTITFSIRRYILYFIGII